MTPPAAQTLAALRRGELAGATTLSLAGAGLRELPVELWALADTLEVLDLAGNALEALPPAFARLRRLRVLFLSGNPLACLPPVLGDCAALSQLGARGCGLREVPAESLPADLRWLTLTDNALSSLPAALGRRPRLQKLMLAGNRLTVLPESLAGHERLELLRLSANRLTALPGWLAELPALAWLAWAANPAEPLPPVLPVPRIPASRLCLGERLGSGASGHIHRARWQPDPPDAAPREVAVKCFKGAMTSDGLPAHEMAACLAAGEHPHLVSACGQVDGLLPGMDAEAPALVMPLLPPHWRTLAAPPSAASCSRDVYGEGQRLPWPAAHRLALAAVDAVAHLHGRGWTHGDVYAHNLLWDGRGRAAPVLSDFGAATHVGAGAAGAPWRALETCAVGVLLAEQAERAERQTDDVPVDMAAALAALAAQCRLPRPADRPALGEVQAALRALAVH